MGVGAGASGGGELGRKARAPGEIGRSGVGSVPETAVSAGSPFPGLEPGPNHFSASTPDLFYLQCIMCY